MSSSFRRALTFITCATLLSFAQGCALNFDARSLGVDATMASPASAPAEGEEFRVTRSALFMLWGMLPVSRPSLERVLAGQLIGGERVADLRIRVRSRFVDLLLTVLTGGLIVPRSVTFEGVVVER